MTDKELQEAWLKKNKPTIVDFSYELSKEEKEEIKKRDLEWGKARKERNRYQSNKKMREYYSLNNEKRKEKDRKYREKNREKINERKRERYHQKKLEAQNNS